MARKTSTKPDKITTKKEESQDNCVHHWVIDTPNGPASKGTCKKCGTAKDFLNTLPSSPRNDPRLAP